MALSSVAASPLVGSHLNGPSRTPYSTDDLVAATFGPIGGRAMMMDNMKQSYPSSTIMSSERVGSNSLQVPADMYYTSNPVVESSQMGDQVRTSSWTRGVPIVPTYQRVDQGYTTTAGTSYPFRKPSVGAIRYTTPATSYYYPGRSGSVSVIPTSAGMHQQLQRQQQYGGSVYRQAVGSQGSAYYTTSDQQPRRHELTYYNSSPNYEPRSISSTAWGGGGQTITSSGPTANFSGQTTIPSAGFYKSPNTTTTTANANTGFYPNTITYSPQGALPSGVRVRSYVQPAYPTYNTQAHHMVDSDGKLVEIAYSPPAGNTQQHQGQQYTTFDQLNKSPGVHSSISPVGAVVQPGAVAESLQPRRKKFLIKRHTAGCCGALNGLGIFDYPGGSCSGFNCRGCCDREHVTYSATEPTSLSDNGSIEVPSRRAMRTRGPTASCRP